MFDFCRRIRKMVTKVKPSNVDEAGTSNNGIYTSNSISILDEIPADTGVTSNGHLFFVGSNASPASELSEFGNTQISGFANISGNVYVGNSTVFWTANSTTVNVNTIDVDTTVTGNLTVTGRVSFVGRVKTPESYGAVGDGTTDDTAAIQAAIDSLTDGETLLFTKNYLVSVGTGTGTTPALLIYNKNRIRLTGKGRIFFSSSADYSYMRESTIINVDGTCDDIQIDSLFLEGSNKGSTSLNATSMVSGKTYSIKSAGTTDFTTLGSASNGEDQKFIYNGASVTGDGVVYEWWGQNAVAVIGYTIPDLNATNIRIHNLTIKNINVGIAIYARSGDTIDGFQVYNNNLYNILGSATGSGYGINVTDAINGHLYGNIIDNACRHSIYQASGIGTNNIWENNTVVNHRKPIGDFTGNTGTIRAAVSLSRSTDVMFVNNKIDTFWDTAIAVDTVTSDSKNCSSVMISGNYITNRQNAASDIIIGEELTPTSYFTEKVYITNNNFEGTPTTFGSNNPCIYIQNGRQIVIENNKVHFKGTVSTYMPPLVTIGKSGVCDSASLDYIFVRNNIGTSVNAGSGKMFVELLGGVSSNTVTTKYWIDNNLCRDWPIEVGHLTAIVNDNQSLVVPNVSNNIVEVKRSSIRFDGGYGVDFAPSSNNAGMTSELLSDYEAGTFTPTLTRASSAPTLTFAVSPVGKYVKIGHLVFVSIKAQISGVTAAGSGATQISGLPFASNDHQYGGNGSFGYDDAFVNTVTGCWIDSTSIYFRSGTQSSSNDTGGWQAGYLNLNVVYYTDT